MDAKALFTSLTANRSAEIIKEEVVNSNIKFENVNMEEVGIYLRENLSNEYIKDNGYDELLPIRKRKRKKRQASVHENDKSSDEYEFVDCLEDLFVEEYDDIEDEVDVNLDEEVTNENLHVISKLHDAPKKSQNEEVTSENGEALCVDKNKNDDTETSNDGPGEDHDEFAFEDEADKSLETKVCNENVQIELKLQKTPRKSQN